MTDLDLHPQGEAAVGAEAEKGRDVLEVVKGEDLGPEIEGVDSECHTF